MLGVMAKRQKFQSTSLVRGTTLIQKFLGMEKIISIHVPRERDDFQHHADSNALLCISIHVPRERDDCEINKFLFEYFVYLSIININLNNNILKVLYSKKIFQKLSVNIPVILCALAIRVNKS